MLNFSFCAILLLIAVEKINGHGYMLNPANRASQWRFDPNATINYDDNAYFCGGRSVQWELNGGNCGECGDDWALPKPRSNENTGMYSTGKIWATYEKGSVIEVMVRLTANHVGTFSYSLCDLKDPTKAEEEACFFDVFLEDGSKYYPVSPLDMEIYNKVKLPDNFTCEHCVLRWHYRAGNSWGQCDNGDVGMGCGPQETFRSCSDIKIV